MLPSLGRKLLRCELALNTLELSLLRVLHLLLLLLQVIQLQMHMLIRLLLLILHLLLRMILAFVICWTLSWPFRRLMVSLWWTCSQSFRLCVRIWRALAGLLHHLLLMMSLDCPLAIHHKKGEYLYMLMGRFCVFVDRGSFRLYLGDSWCIVYWLMMYLFL